MGTYSKKIWKRRDFLKTCAAATATSAIPTSGLIAGLDAVSAFGQKAELKSTRNANPMIGTGWRGHMFPGAVAPFGLVQVSPDTSGPPDPTWNKQGDWYGWQHCSGYNYTDNVVQGFTHTHVQGTGGIDLGDVLVMPVVEGKNWYWDTGILEKLTEMQIEALGQNSGLVYGPSEVGYRSFFSHKNETASPGYYSVHLDTPNVRAELTATTRCGMHRYCYDATSAQLKQGLMVDLAHGLGSKVYAAELMVESKTRIVGSRSTHGWARDRHVYFVLELEEPVASVQVNVDGNVVAADVGQRFTGKEVKTILELAPEGVPLVVRIGISPTGIEGAKKNLAAEISGWDFDSIAKKTSQDWDDALA